MAIMQDPKVRDENSVWCKNSNWDEHFGEEISRRNKDEDKGGRRDDYSLSRE